ncbi:MAG: magnesium-translocating P-type ATPase [Tabrizicola sp.]
MSAVPKPGPDAWWSLSSGDVLQALGTTQAGLSVAEAPGRAMPGLAESRPQTAVALLAAQLRNPLVLILALSALIAALVHSYSDAAIILGILLLSALMGFAQEWRAAREVQDLLSRIRRMARVRRDGTEMLIPAAEVVPGDVLILQAGDLVAADARILSADSLFAIEAPLTGEPFPVAKTPEPAPVDAPLAARSSALWTGTSIRSGTGEAVAIVTGRATVFGGIAASLERREGETAFTTGLRRFGLMLSEVMLVIVLVVFAANTWLDRPFFDSLTFALALAVGLTPQMLPAMLSVTLASGARRLARGGVIVRRLSSIENLGSMDVLCTDKTGTLTEGRVALDRATDDEGAESAKVLELAVLNARLQRGIDNALDGALLAEGKRRSLPEVSVEKLGEVPYDFSRRRLSVVVADAAGALMVTKGAALPVLDCCLLTPERRVALAARVEAWGREGYRVLAVAVRRLPRKVEWTAADEQEMRFEGFLLFSDPLRPDAHATVAALRARGISVRIITGDNRFVAAHVAEGVGVPHARIATETDIASLGADALSRLVARTHVFAEIDPAGKERIVAALRQAGHVTGYIGDGINDATALRLADIGLSVEGAADVARDAADMILTSPDLGVVLKGVDEGRRAFANTLKYLRIATAASFGNMVSMAAASVVLPFLPLTAGQILLNNLLSDIPMLALAGDRVDPEARHRPHRWQSGRLLRFMAVFGLLSSAFDLMTFWLLVSGFAAPAELFRTAWFIESLMSELLFTLSIRTVRPFWANQPSGSLAGLSLAVAGVAMALPWLPGAALLGLVPLPPPVMLALAAVLCLYLTATELLKWGERSLVTSG